MGRWTMNDHRVNVAGNDLNEQAVHLSGVLAELGVTRLVVTSCHGVERTVLARETDLPGLLGSGDVHMLSCPLQGLCVTVEARLHAEGATKEITARLAGGGDRGRDRG